MFKDWSLQYLELEEVSCCDCGKSGPCMTRPGTVTACALTVKLLHTLCGGPGTTATRGPVSPHLAMRDCQDVRLLRRCWYRSWGTAGASDVRGLRPGYSPVKLARYLSKYISKDFDNMPREFKEHRYFCSLGIRVPTEKLEMVLVRDARELEARKHRLLQQEILSRVDLCCSLTRSQRSLLLLRL
jgi:hypothetical protein